MEWNISVGETNQLPSETGVISIPFHQGRNQPGVLTSQTSKGGWKIADWQWKLCLLPPFRKLSSQQTPINQSIRFGLAVMAQEMEMALTGA